MLKNTRIDGPKGLMPEIESALRREINPANATFKSPDLDRSYRQYYFSRDRERFVIAMILSVIPVMVFSYSHYQFFGNGAHFYRLTISRVIYRAG